MRMSKSIVITNFAACLFIAASASDDPDDIVPQNTDKLESTIFVQGLENVAAAADAAENTAASHSPADPEKAELKFIMPFIRQCQEKLPVSDDCKTIDPAECTGHSESTVCKSCKKSLEKCISPLIAAAYPIKKKSL